MLLSGYYVLVSLSINSILHFHIFHMFLSLFLGITTHCLQIYFNPIVVFNLISLILKV